MLESDERQDEGEDGHVEKVKVLEVSPPQVAEAHLLEQRLDPPPDGRVESHDRQQQNVDQHDQHAEHGQVKLAVGLDVPRDAEAPLPRVTRQDLQV